MIFNSAKDYNKKVSVLIIGSGPASISLALSLEKKKINSLIVEAGNFEYDAKLQKTYEGINLGNYNFDLTTNRIKQFGGTANVWGKRCRPLDLIDYQNWSKNEINIYKFQSEASKLLHIEEKFNEKILNKNLSQIEFKYSQINFPNHYYNKILKSNYIDVILNSNFLRLDGYSRNFNYAEFLDTYTKIKHKIYSKFFIMGCGGIDNSRYLLLLQQKYGLIDQNLPIGKYWMGHFKTHFGELLADFKKLKLLLNKENYLKQGDTAAIALNSKFIRSKNLENACVFLEPNQISKNKFNEISKKLLCIAPEYTKHLTKLFDKSLLCGTSLEILWGQKSFEKNSITLSDTKYDNFGIPNVEINCNSQKNDLITPTFFMKELGKYFVSTDIGRVHYFDIDNKDKIYWEGNHHIGGTNIGDNLKLSVVNSDLKVHSTNNLYVIGSSIFSNSGHTNPTLSIVQFSLRLGEHLLKRL